MGFMRWILALAVAASLTVTATAANRIRIESTYLGLYCRSTVGIYIENDVELKRICLPLVIRSLEAGWVENIDTVPSMGRLATSLKGSRIFEKGRVDFISPDQVALVFESVIMGGDCLPAGPEQKMTGLSITPNYPWGQFEIDTMAYTPCLTLEILGCPDGAVVPITSFSKGVETVIPNEPAISWFAADSINGRAGGSYQNQCIAIDPNVPPAPITFRLLSGPGQIDPTIGMWTWNSCARDSGTYVITIEAYKKSEGCDYGSTPSFTIRLKPQEKADVNCDGVADVFDLLAQIDYIFSGVALPPCP